MGMGEGGVEGLIGNCLVWDGMGWDEDCLGEVKMKVVGLVMGGLSTVGW